MSSSEEDDRSSSSGSDEESEDDRYQRKRKSGGRSKGKSKRPRSNLFEEEVEEAEEESEEEEEEVGFRETSAKELSRHEKETQARYAERMRQREAFDSKGVEEITREIEQRHRRTYEQQRHYNEEDNEVELSRNKNLPTVTDPRLFAVRCSVGEEKTLMIQMMNKYQHLKQAGKHPQIFSVVSPGTKGYVYIEARSETEVQKLLQGLRNVYRKLTLVPLAQMTTVMNVSKSSQITKKGDYVRVSTYPYKGDLGQVYELSGSGRIWVKIVPRIDYEMALLYDPDERKARRKQRIVPPKKFFNVEESRAKNIDSSKRIHPRSGQTLDYVDALDQWFDKGYLVKEFSSKYVKTVNVNPSVDELQSFRLGRALRDDDEQDIEADLQDGALIEQLGTSFSSSTGIKNTFSKGDFAVVDEGELKFLKGQIVSVSNDGNVKFQPLEEGIRDQILEFPSAHLKKFFQIGNHVKVTGGKYAGETGTVVKVIDSGEKWRAIVYADSSSKEIQVFVDDLHLSEEIASGSDSLAGYQTMDVVVLGQGQVGIIVKVGIDSFDVLEGNNKVRKIRVNEIRYKVNPKKVGTAMDKNKNSISVNDVVKVMSGEYKGMEGTVKHIHRSLLFLFSRQRIQNSGIFVDRARNCQLSGFTVERGSGVQGGSSAGRGMGMGGRGRGRGRGRVDDLLGKTVSVKKGRWKGYLGIVVSATDQIVRVEMHSKNKTVPFDRSWCQVVGDASGAKRKNDGFSRGGWNNNGRPASSMIGSEDAIHRYENLGTPMHAPPTPMTVISGGGGSAWDPKSNLASSVATPSAAWQQVNTPAFREPPTPAAYDNGSSGVRNGIPSTPATPATPATPGFSLGADENDSNKDAGFKENDKVKVKSGNDAGKIGIVQGIDSTEAIIVIDGDIKILPTSDIEKVE